MEQDYDPFEALKNKRAATKNDGELEEYEAFRIGQRRQNRLEIRQCLSPHHTPSYFHLLDIIPNGFFGTEIVLIYTFLIVEIQGKNLRPLYDSLKAGNCEYIQDFHENVFLPADPKKPFIDSIKVTSKNQIST